MQTWVGGHDWKAGRSLVLPQHRCCRHTPHIAQWQRAEPIIVRVVFSSITALLSLGLVVFPSNNNTLTSVEKRDGWELLFNGRTLSGWYGEPTLWKVLDGTIVGSSGRRLRQNSFLITRQEFSDFILKIDIKLSNRNSGVQFRSKALSKYAVRGYQADATQGKAWGNLHGENTGRRVIVDGWTGKGEKVVRSGEWNHYEIYCKGEHIKLTLNGLVTVDTHDTMFRTGVIAFQLHRGQPMNVAFRNIKIKSLGAKFP